MDFKQRRQVSHGKSTKSETNRKAPKLRHDTPRSASINSLKKKVRDLSRLLERSVNLRADVRIEHERALAAFQHELVSAENERRRQRMIKKYHMVRFFERQKATRSLKKLQRRLAVAASPLEADMLNTEIHNAEVDLNYTLFYPLDQKYISLYAGEHTMPIEKGAGKDMEDRENLPMWREVERRMKDGSLDDLRNGVRQGIKQPANSKITPGFAVDGKRKRKEHDREGAKPKEASQSAHNIVQEEQGDDSDGGFFEE